MTATMSTLRRPKPPRAIVAPHPWGLDDAADAARTLANLRRSLAAVTNSDDLPAAGEAVARAERELADAARCGTP